MEGRKNMFLQNIDKLIALVGLHNSGKSYWLRQKYLNHGDGAVLTTVQDIPTLQSWLSNPSLTLLCISNFADSWDHNQIHDAFALINAANIKVCIEIHNTLCMNQDYLLHNHFYLCHSKDVPPLPLQDCVDRELRFGHNLQRMFNAEAFWYPLPSDKLII